MTGRIIKGLKIAGLGIVIWSLSLVWPEVNSVQPWPVLAGLASGLGTVVLFYVLKAVSLTPGFEHTHSAATYGHGREPRRPSHPLRLS